MRRYGSTNEETRAGNLVSVTPNDNSLPLKMRHAVTSQEIQRPVYSSSRFHERDLTGVTRRRIHPVGALTSSA